MAFVLVFVITAPSNDYWMFLLWPMSLLIFNLFEKKIMLKPLIVIICILITFQAYVNFTYDIYPKSQAGPKDLSLLAHLGQELNEIDHYIFVFDGEGERFFNEIWYINYIRKQKSIKLINAQHLETMLDITNENDFLAALGIVKGTRIGIVSHHSITSYYHSKLQANNIFIDDSPVIGKVLSPRVYALTNKLARSINLNLTKVLGKNENFIYEKLAQYPYWYNPYKFKPYFLNFQIFNNAN
ncbi:MAG: hypothetical protein HON90_16700 [Halobacteriovoraceae bacterium]|nr:hypothetical protein [Halobacteriovoraceae bacterium]